MLRIWAICWVVVALALANEAVGDTPHFRIEEDAALNAAVAQAREETLRGKTFDRFDVVVLVPGENGTWRRGAHNPAALAYPASCVKLVYLVAAMNWCRENGHPPTYLDKSTRPMIVSSSNPATGEVVDAITSTTNYADMTTTSDPRYAPWLEKRRYAANYLEQRGLLGKQLILHKTYPSNTSPMPEGAEKLIRQEFGMNMMEPRMSASLMLELVKKKMEPQAYDYMMEILEHNPRGGGSVMGFGLPPGSRYFNKPGLAYDTLEDIAYVVLPNGKEFVIAAYSNAFKRPYSQDGYTQSASQLGTFTERFIELAGMSKNLEPKLVATSDSNAFRSTCIWERVANDANAKSTNYAVSRETSATGTFVFTLPKAGKYELSTWHPASDDRPSSVSVSINGPGVAATTVINQKRVGGRWQSLGNHTFREGGEATVTLMALAPGALAADAVKLERWPDAKVAVPAVATNQP